MSRLSDPTATARFAELVAIADLAFVTSTAGKVGLTPEMNLLLALVICDGYEIGGRSSVAHDGSIAKARVVGTYNAVNRSAQYTTAEPRELLRAVNEAWTKIRNLEKELLKRDTMIAQLQDKLSRSQVVNVTLTAIITTLAWKGLEFLLQALR